MNVHFNTDPVRASTAAAVTRRVPERCLFLLTPSKEECGVELFARLLVSALQNDDPDDGCAVLAVSSRWRGFPPCAARSPRPIRSFSACPWWRGKDCCCCRWWSLCSRAWCAAGSMSSCMNGRRCMDASAGAGTVPAVQPHHHRCRRFMVERDRRRRTWLIGAVEKMPAGANAPDHPRTGATRMPPNGFCACTKPPKLRRGDRLFRRDL